MALNKPLSQIALVVLLAGALGAAAWKISQPTSSENEIESADKERADEKKPAEVKPESPPSPIAKKEEKVGAVQPVAQPAKPQEDPLPKIVQLRAEPETLTLNGREDSRRFIVRGKTPAGNWIDLTHRAKAAFDNKFVRHDEGYLYPVADGKTTVKLIVGEHEAQLPVAVAGQSAEKPVSFVNDVMPVFARSGCNAGTCHGAAKGRNGFKLSLRGYDPAFDHEQVVEDLAGRRIDRKEPANSLVLLKPTQSVPHEGKVAFPEGGRYYQIVQRWIAEGCVSDFGTARRPERLEILPREPILGDGGRQQLVVLAHFPGGVTRDVTRDAIYSSSADAVASVDGVGLVKALRKGESAVLVRYEGQFAVNRVSVLTPDEKYRWSEPPAFNYIDELVYRKQKTLELLPSELCSDHDFLRRLYLDLLGIPPTSTEVRAFLDDKRDTQVKRKEAIDKALARPEFVDFQTLRLADLMQVNRKFLGVGGMTAFRDYLKKQVETDAPWDQTVTAILTGASVHPETPRGAFYKIATEPGMAVENTTHLFLGIRFNCNKCHDHPFERWTWDNYYEFAAYFSDKSDVKHPRTGQVVNPRFPFTHAGFDTKAPPTGTRQQQLAKWITSPENPYFARSTANRLWAQMVGHGIIEPVDDLRAANPPSNPELLDALAADFVKNKFSVKHLLRTIANSRTYQLSIKANDTNREDVDNFARARPRRLTAEQLLDSVRAATGTQNQFPGMPIGTRAAQLPDPGAVPDAFLKQFGKPIRESPCACERRNEMDLGQAMALMNGPTVAEAIAAPTGRAAQLAKANLSDSRLIEEMYLAVLCRYPTSDEVVRCVKVMFTSTDRQENAQDLLWALLNTPEFLFNR